MTIIKYFFIMFACIYAYQKLTSSSETVIFDSHNAVFSLICCLIIAVIRCYMPIATLFAIILFVNLFAAVHLKVKPSLNFLVPLLSFGISYLASLAAAFLLSPLAFIPAFKLGQSPIPNTLSSLCIGLFQTLLVYLFFLIKRFQTGLPRIVNRFSGDIGTFLGVMIVFLGTTAYIDETNSALSVLVIFLILIVGLILYYWWRGNITNDYLQRSQEQREEILENKLKSQAEEIEKLSKIIHKDNKLIKALQLKVSHIHVDENSKTNQTLEDELDIILKEREHILYAHHRKEIPEYRAEVFLIDMMIDYLRDKADQLRVRFDVSIVGDINYMVDHIIEKHDLSTLIADLGENAIYSLRISDAPKVLLLLGVSSDYYHLDIFDNGCPFQCETFKNLGKNRYTTHAHDGGSGIGLMTTVEIVQKYSASLEIEEILNIESYRKRVSVVFDMKSQIRVFSDREDVIYACKENGIEILA